MMVVIMSSRVPSFFLLVPGTWPSADVVKAALEPLGVPLMNAGEMLELGGLGIDIVDDPTGFGDVVEYMPGLLSEEQIDVCRRTKTAALIEVAGTLDQQRDLVATLCEVLERAGGMAVRFEASGKSHSLGAVAEKLAVDNVSELLQLALVYSFDGEHYFSSGMQQFDLPDIEVSGIDGDVAGHWLHMFCAYAVIEDPTLVDGHTFSPSEDTPRQTLERWPDLRHGPDDGRQNPFGLWRALPPGADALAVLDPEPKIMPPLLVLLAVREQQEERALTEPEVDDIVANAAAVTMDAADARAIERERGFVDINPRRAWAQWSQLRETR